MARIRSVKPEYWTSEQVMNMSRDARLLFIGLWNFCDDNGIHPASALSLKAEVLPGDTLTADQVMVFIDEMIEQGLVEEYDVDGRAFWRVTGWRRHQRIDQPTFRHPTGDTRGDTSDTGDTGDTKGGRVTGVTYKRLGGKQRQIVLRKLRERDGDACHLCGDPSNLSILSLAPNGDENASDINSLRLICATCKRAQKRGDARKIAGDTHGDTRSLVGDSATESSRVESSGEERKGEIKTKPISSSHTSTTAGDTASPGSGDETPRRRFAGEIERDAQIAALLCQRGIKAMAQNLIVRSWAADSRVSDEVLIAAIEKAGKSKQGEEIPVKYLEKTVATILLEQAAPPISGKPLHVVQPIPIRKPQGTDPKGPDESYEDWQARVEAAERAMRKAQNP